MINTQQPSTKPAADPAGSGVQYLRNGKIFHVSSVAASGSYVVDTAFIYTGTAVGDVMISTDGSGVTRHVYDTAGQRVMRVDPNGTKTLFVDGTELAWAPGATDVTVARTYPGGVLREHDGTIGYRIADERGSVIADVAAATGTVTHRRYLPYGQPRSAGLDGRTGYLGHIHDPNGWIELTHRYLNPTLGAFTSVDPLVTETGEPYIYASANPTTLADPDGLSPCANVSCPDGIPVVHYNQHDMRSWVWLLVKFVEPDPVGDGIGDQLDETGSRQVPFDYAKQAHDYFTRVSGPAGRLTGDDLKLIAFRPWEGSGPSTFTFGITTGLCIFLCIEVGISSEGPYLRPGVGGAIDTPGIVIDDEAPTCGAGETRAYLSASAGPAQGLGLSGSRCNWSGLTR